MKRLKVFSFNMDSFLELYYSLKCNQVIDQWLSSEEYKFIERNSISVEQVRTSNHDRLEDTISFYAVMEEKIETFWRLKYK